MTALLAIESLTVELPTAAGLQPVVTGLDLTIDEGGAVGLVGESGSGKTMTALAVLGLLPRGARASGAVRFRGRDLLTLDEHELNRVRGSEIAMVFQEPMTSLNPLFTVGAQIADVLRVHRGLSKRAAWDRAVELLALVRIPAPTDRAREYPHSLSGGMRQRVLLAMALACDPAVLIADEPTTAVDATIQAEMLELLRELQDASGMAILLITHDLAVVAEMCDRVAVMYAGEVVEEASTTTLFTHPQHPYTAGLIGCLPQAGNGRELRWIEGSVPGVGEHPVGCRFHPRCAAALPLCAERRASLEHGPQGAVRCHRRGELILEGAGGG